MLKFVHRKHFNKIKGQAKIVVYYSLSEIILGVLLIMLASFFAMDYLKNNLKNNELNIKSSVGINTMPSKSLIKGK
jgi:hypothetical protein